MNSMPFLAENNLWYFWGSDTLEGPFFTFKEAWHMWYLYWNNPLDAD